jgi:methionyl-tRNA formyltransferase
MDLIFLGTPAFAVPTLEKIIEAGHTVLTVITQPDRPKGRGQSLASSPVKDAAARHGLPVFQPERIRRAEVVERLAAFKTDAMVVVGYGQIIPQSIIDQPRHGIINVHASLLPKYRGAAPVQWAIASGETVTGVTTMRIDAGLDTGDMLLRAETPIAPDETAVQLGMRLGDMGADLLVETLAGIDSIRPEKQDSSQASLAPILKKEDGHINWKRPQREILNRIRGFVPWPGCYGFWRGMRFHIWKAVPARLDLAPGEPGTVGRQLFVGCGDDAVEVLELQLEGKRRMTAKEFLSGRVFDHGEVIE